MRALRGAGVRGRRQGQRADALSRFFGRMRGSLARSLTSARSSSCSTTTRVRVSVRRRLLEPAARPQLRLRRRDRTLSRSVADVDYTLRRRRRQFRILVGSGVEPPVRQPSGDCHRGVVGQCREALAQRRAQRRPLQDPAPRHRSRRRGNQRLAQRRQARSLPRRRGETAPSGEERGDDGARQPSRRGPGVAAASACHQARRRGHGGRGRQGRQASAGERYRHHRRGSWRGSRPTPCRGIC